ncbi:MAG: M28 family peptidase [Acidobacteria bacterium]|nr:M28 family peptidase [Acidobacteriota bacterium]
MHRSKTLTLAAALLAPLALGADFSGAQALEYTKALVAFGPRPAGTPALQKTQDYIVRQLKAQGWTVTEDAFPARTPAGVLQMKNIIASRKGTNGKAVVVTGHYDTKRFPFKFVGANDGGASGGLLLEMARALKDRPFKSDVYLVFFDGEEAVRDWTSTDSLYGSRHLAEKWQKDGTNARITGLINVDMIGDRDLHVVSEMYSSEPLRRLLWQVAAQLGEAKRFDGQELPIEDDHVPFLRLGVRALDLIDFEYGPRHAWWHTTEDTVDKLSADSLQAVGKVVAETLRRLDQ